MKTLILLLLFSNICFANTTLLIACSSSSAEDMLALAKKFASTKDNIEKENNGCIEIITSKHKEDLFNRILMLKFPDVRIKSSSHMAIDQKVCRINVDKVRISKSQNANIGIGYRKGNARQNDINGQSTSRSQLIISNNKSGKLDVRGSMVEVKCRILNNGMYDLEIKHASRQSSASTSLTLSPGQRVEIGGYVKDDNGGNQSIGFPTGVSFRKNNLNETTKIYLSIM